MSRISPSDKKAIINTIVIFLRAGVDPEIDKQFIIAFLKNNNVIKTTSKFTIRKYICEARKIVRADFNTKAWMTEKVQDAMLKDYREVWQHHDNIIKDNDIQIRNIHKQAEDISMRIHKNKKRAYDYVDNDLLIKAKSLQLSALDQKMKMMAQGFVQYKIKRYIESLQQNKPNISQLENDPIIQSLNNSPVLIESEKKKELPEQTESFQIAEHLKPFEEKLNKKLCSLDE